MPAPLVSSAQTASPTVTPAPATSATPGMPQGSNLNQYQEFLWRQSMRMYNNGATPAQIGDYITRAENNNLRAIIMPSPEAETVETPGMLKGVTQQVLRGATFGFSDEALGTLAGILSPSMTRQEGRDRMRSEQEAFQAAHPTASLAANVAGGVASMAVPGAAALGAGKGLMSIGVGALTGALAGAGEAQGGLSDRSKAALLGGTIGAVAGPVVSAVARGAAGATGRVANRVVPEGFKARLRGMMASLPGTPQRAALTMLAEAAEADGVNIAQAASRVEQRAALGTPTTAVDVMGDHTMALAEEALNFRTPEQQNFTARIMTRAVGAGERLLDMLGAGTRLGLQNVDDLRTSIINERSTLATPLYQQSHQLTANVTPRIQDALKQKLWREVYEAGRQVAEVETSAGIATGLPVPQLKDLVRRSGKRQEVFHDVPAQLPVRALDYMKQGLDAVINAAGRDGRPAMSTRHARALRQQLDNILSDVDAQHPVYAQARRTWAGFSAELDAMQDGMDSFLKLPPAQISQRLAESKSPDLWRIGAIQSIADAVHGARASAKEAEQFFGASLFGSKDRTQLQRIQALFGDEAVAREFADRVAGEAALVHAGQRLGARGAPNVQRATNRFNPAGRVRAITEKVPGVGGLLPDRETRAREVANEVTRLIAEGLDNPQALAAKLRALPVMRQTTARAVAATRVAPATTAVRESEAQRQR